MAIKTGLKFMALGAAAMALAIGATDAAAIKIKARWGGGDASEKTAQKLGTALVKGAARTSKSKDKDSRDSADAADALPSTPESKSPRVINRVSDPEPAQGRDGNATAQQAAITTANDPVPTLPEVNAVVCIAGCYQR